MNPTTLFAVIKRDSVEKDGVALSLKRACEQAGIRYEALVSEDIELDSIASMQFATGSLLYRVSTDTKSAIIESMLILSNPGVFTTIYSPHLLQVTSRTYHELCVQMERGLQIIPTLIIDETWQNLDVSALEPRAARLGGFPIIVKTLGLSHGNGVQKVDDAQALQALLAQASFDDYGMIARKYLAEYRHYRLIVVDGAVVASIEYHKPADDFRTNASKSPIVSAVPVADVPPELVQLALDGVSLRSSILGGVDILVDQTDGNGYLAEVNVPCFYARAEGPTGIDISGQLLAAMLRKRDGAVA